jgi:hypothetical protein
MLLANQSPNLVFASPNGVSGQPDFRSLTANDVFIDLGISAVTMNANTANIQYTDTYFTPEFKIPANAIQEATTFKITLVGGPLYLYHDQLSIRLGNSGSTSDNVAFGVSLYDPGSLGSPPFIFLVTIRSGGNSSPVVTVPISPIAIDGSGPRWLTPQHIIVDTTQDLYLGASYYFGVPGQGTNVFELATIQQIK